MKTYEFTLNHDGGNVTLRTKAKNLASAQRVILDTEKAPKSAIQSWRVVPTPKQIKRTKSLMRGI